MDKEPIDYVKRNRISRSRGYSFEHNIVQYLEKIGWRAKRLGGSSTNLPDILATHRDTMYSMEAKSVMMPAKKSALIPYDQVLRCIDMLTMFPVYSEQYLVFAFKFSLKGYRPAYHYFAFDVNDTTKLKQFYLFPYYFVKFASLGELTIIEAVKVGKKLIVAPNAKRIHLTESMHTIELPFKTPLTLYSDFGK